MTMIKTLKGFTYKSFKNYDVPSNCEFRQRNVFFGYNGKGKSALAKGIYDEALKIFGEDGVRFFNRDYVETNLLIANSNDKIGGVKVNFGKQNVDVENQIANLEKQIVSIEDIKAKKNEPTNNITKTLNGIYSEFTSLNGIKRKSVNDYSCIYDVYKSDLERGIKLMGDREKLLNAPTSVNVSNSITSLQNFIVPSFQLCSEDEIKEAEAIVGKTYEINDIPSIEVINWLKEGIKLHTHDKSGTCKFCGGQLTITDVEKRVASYLADKKQQDQAALNTFRSKLLEIINKDADFKMGIDHLAVLTGTQLKSFYDDVHTAIEEIKGINGVITQKLEHFDQTFSFDSEKILGLIKSLENVQSKLNESKNDTLKRLNQSLTKANDIAKGQIAQKINDDNLIKTSVEKLDEINEEIKTAETKNENTRKQIRDLKNTLNKTSDFADFLNGLLNQLEIGFMLDVQDEYYLIKNKEDRATLTVDDISEGEKNILALLYFYYSLFDDKEQTRLNDDIECLIVDDPISSLDNNNRVVVIELNRNLLNLKDKAQVFLFTHGWDDFCDICYAKKGDGETRKYEVKKKEGFGSYLIETKLNETPYTHDFREIYEFSLESAPSSADSCIIYHYPNVMRRVLETFMKFKVISDRGATKANRSKVIDALGLNIHLPQEMIGLDALLNVCNVYSHRNADNPDEIHRSAIFLMEAIKKADPVHFKTMTTYNQTGD